MKRGIYVARVDISLPHLAGVARKIQSQVQALESAFGTVDLFVLEGTHVMRGGTVMKSFPGGDASRHLLHLWNFYATVAAWNAPLDYAYIRYQRSSLAFIWLLYCLRRKNPHMRILVEVPTWPYRKEEISFRERMLGFTDRLLCRFIRHYVDWVVTFSAEQEIMGIPTIRTDNGTDVFSVEPIQPPGVNGGLHILGLSNLSFWHGYDRVLEGLAYYRAKGGSTDIVFEIVGSGNELSRLQADAKRLNIESMVRFHGPLFKDELSAVMSRCHIAISSIGIHRVQNDTSTLKSREYCARGIPFALGHLDRDFLDKPYVFHVPADETPLDIAALLAFLADLKVLHPTYATQMRIFAEGHLTWSAKFAPVIEILHNTNQGTSD